MKGEFVIAVDFDGTLVEHTYPGIGPQVASGVEWCKRFQLLGAKVFLWNMRSDRNNPEFPNEPIDTCLTNAVDWCREQGLEFWGVNENPAQVKSGWSTSRKQYANVYIDDAAFGCPLQP